MSSRALRRAQKELEEKRQLEVLRQKAEAGDSDSDEKETTAGKSNTSAFALLNNDDNAEDSGAEADADHSQSEPDSAPFSQTAESSTKASKRKKKKKKAKAGHESNQPSKAGKANQHIDEIEQALKELSMKNGAVNENTEIAFPNKDEPTEGFYSHISIDTQHLHVANEMRRLFGRAALEDEHPAENDPQTAGGPRAVRRMLNQGRRTGRMVRTVAGQSTATSRLASASMRRNIFVQGKQSWRPGSTAGLGMEIDRREGDVVFFRFVHARGYQDVQRHFQACVASHDPERLISLLHFNPYHVSTLLQVADIAEQQSDYATVADLLERALFALGRAVHSHFARLLSEGKARLDFKFPENREFWLAGWRYISNLSMRATWRTVFEWAKLLWAVNPNDDPYEMKLVIDQYAIRARQQEWLRSIDLGIRNLQKSVPSHWLYSLALAKSQVQTTSGATESRQDLREGMEKYPWIAARLFQELNLEPVPPGIWGKQPKTDLDQLYTELYATRAKDVWNTPEATSLLMEVAYTVSKDNSRETHTLGEISIDICRHVLMTHKRELVALLPPSITRQVDSFSDPLPPTNSVESYDATPTYSREHQSVVEDFEGMDPQEILREFSDLQSFMRYFMSADSDGATDSAQRGEDPSAPTRHVNHADDLPPIPSDETIIRRLAESGLSVEDLVQRRDRSEQLGRHIARLLEAGALDQTAVMMLLQEHGITQDSSGTDTEEDMPTLEDNTDDEFPELEDVEGGGHHS